MIPSDFSAASNQKEVYRLLLAQMEGLLEEEPHVLPALCNASALVMAALPQLNWSGFYLMAQGQLVLGPFQGKPACIHIPLDRGVCGAAAREKQTQRVADVHLFPGHIACDSASRSELVVPLILQGQVLGVLDLDSPIPNRFSEEDQEGLEALGALLAEKCLWDGFRYFE